MSVGSVRALEPSDAASARALASAQLPVGSRYRARTIEQLDIALTGSDPECTGLVATTPGVSEASGIMLFGAVAGANGVVKLHAIVGSDGKVLTSLLEALVGQSAHQEQRMIMCELPDDAPFVILSAVLRDLGFAREGRVEDYFADGIALDLLVHRG